MKKSKFRATPPPIVSGRGAPGPSSDPDIRSCLGLRMATRDANGSVNHFTNGCPWQAYIG
jgi:hypothetical protein